MIATGNATHRIFYHGRRAALGVGDLIALGYVSNYGTRQESNFVHFSAVLGSAIWGAELALGDRPERIDIVEPTGPFEDDPNLTDKNFPGNSTKSYRTREPLRVAGEVTEWQPQSPDRLKSMKNGLQDLKRRGVEAIDD
jgi:rifampin ADP-ribosylating transferase